MGGGGAFNNLGAKGYATYMPKLQKSAMLVLRM